jgi:hypothetical protein
LTFFLYLSDVEAGGVSGERERTRTRQEHVIVERCVVVFAHLLFHFFFHSFFVKGTDFPDLGITVMPKKGRALLWPSVMNADPMGKDGRMEHQALPVEKGLKFGANLWTHMYVGTY